MPATYFACVMKTTTIEAAKKMAAEEYGKAATQLTGYLTSLGMKPMGNMHTIFYTWDEKANRTEWAIAFPVEKEFKAGSEVVCKKVDAAKTVWAMHIGAYEKLADVHNSVMAAAMKKGNMGVTIEEYVKGPAQEKDPQKYETKIIYTLTGK